MSERFTKATALQAIDNRMTVLEDRYKALTGRYIDRDNGTAQCWTVKNKPGRRGFGEHATNREEAHGIYGAWFALRSLAQEFR